MVNTRPGYWDVDRCTWVGVDPAYVVPPTRMGSRRQAPASADVELPIPRDGADDSQVAAEPV